MACRSNGLARLLEGGDGFSTEDFACDLARKIGAGEEAKESSNALGVVVVCHCQIPGQTEACHRLRDWYAWLWYISGGHGWPGDLGCCAWKGMADPLPEPFWDGSSLGGCEVHVGELGFWM